MECRTGIWMLSTDKDEEIVSLLTSDRWWQNLQPFWACTIGYRCEIECLLYLQYSIWQVLGFAEIGESLWDTDGNYENRVYQAVNRLRVSLKQFPSLSIDRISVGNYQLKIREI